MTPDYEYGKAQYYIADCLEWLRKCPPQSIHGVVTDPPFSMKEYSLEEDKKRIMKKGGVWRMPPKLDGYQRAAVPRFSILTNDDLEELEQFFSIWARTLMPVLCPGAHVLVASNPLVSPYLSQGIINEGYERRGEVIRLVQTLRGGDRPKNAHQEFSDVSVLPRSMFEPWLLFRKPVEGRVQDNLRKWKTGGLRRISDEQPFGDVIKSAPTHRKEKALAPHSSLKPQKFLRQVVRAILPLGEGVVLDPFSGSGSTLAAAEAVGYQSIGVEKNPAYLAMAQEAIPHLAALEIPSP